MVILSREEVIQSIAGFHNKSDVLDGHGRANKAEYKTTNAGTGWTANIGQEIIQRQSSKEVEK